MTEYNHHCPDLSPNSTRPNMTRFSCSERVRTKMGKCARCTSRVGYEAPAKGKPKRIRKKVVPAYVYCKCGNERQPFKTLCPECVRTNRYKVQRLYRIKANIVKYEKLLAECKKELSTLLE